MMRLLPLAIFAGLALAAPPPAPEPLVVRDAYGRVVTRCTATPMYDGVWTAGHCLRKAGRPGRTLWIGDKRVELWSHDKYRDLGHAPVKANVGVTVRRARSGETVRIDRARRPPTWATVIGTVTYMDERLVKACVQSRVIELGDSGAGWWAEDGALVAILTRASFLAGKPVKPAGGPCSGRQVVLGVQIP